MSGALSGGTRLAENVSELPRQDSNLKCLNQNQECCRLHHGGTARERAVTSLAHEIGPTDAYLRTDGPGPI